MAKARTTPKVKDYPAPKLEAVYDLLFRRLDGNPDGVPYTDLKRETEAMGISDATLSQAGYALGVVRVRVGQLPGERGRTRTLWTLPD